MWLWLVLGVRLPPHPNEHESLPFLLDSDVVPFLQSHNRSVIMFGALHYDVAFVNYAIFHYSDRIGFAFANSSAMPAQCFTFPCIVAYAGERMLPLIQPAHSSAFFMNWCANVLNPTDFRLTIPEQVRLIFDGQIPTVFCVDCDSRPANVPLEAAFYIVPRSALLYFGLGSESGNSYLFHPSDHKFLQSDAKWENVHESPIMSGMDKVETKAYFCGYFLDMKETTGDTDSDILLRLAAKFGDNLTVVLTNEHEGCGIFGRGRLYRLAVPFFFMFKSGSVGGERWFIKGEGAHDYDQVESLVIGVLSGTEPYRYLNTTLPKQPPDPRFREVNALTVTDAVITPDKVTLLMVTSPWCPHCSELRPILKATSRLLDPSVVEFFWINGIGNDMPTVIPDYRGYPAMWMWPAGENYTEAVPFTRNRTIGTILSYIDELGQSKNFTMPEYNETELMAAVSSAEGD
jgi:thiol-disulfide isomerase/thioredoxin